MEKKQSTKNTDIDIVKQVRDEYVSLIRGNLYHIKQCIDIVEKGFGLYTLGGLAGTISKMAHYAKCIDDEMDSFRLLSNLIKCRELSKSCQKEQKEAQKQKVKKVVSEAIKYVNEAAERTQEAIVTIKASSTMRVLDAHNALKTFKRINQYAFKYRDMLIKPKEMFLQKKNKKEKKIASIQELFDVLAKCDKDDKIFIVGRK